LNPHEIQVWKFAGKLQFQMSYIIFTACVNRFQPRHTPPKFTHMMGKDMPPTMGVNADDHVFICRFRLREDAAEMIQMVESGILTPEEAREEYSYRGEGIVDAQEWNRKKNGKFTFAPKGRSRAWKGEKRALIDAYRRAGWEPTRAQIQAVRESLGYDQMEPEDFADTDGLAPDDAVALAKSHAQERQRTPMTAEEAQDAASALYPGQKVVIAKPDKDVQDGEFTMTDEATPEPLPDPLDDHFPRDGDEAASDTEPKSAPKLETKGDYFNAILAAAKEFHKLTSLNFKRVPDSKWNIKQAKKALEIIASGNKAIEAAIERGENVDFYDIHSEVGQALAQV